MTNAPERIWAQDAEPEECNYIGGGYWDAECGNTQYPHMVEYVRADLVPQWQPIETAPKDGGEILFFGVEGCEMVFWCNYGDGGWLNSSGKYPFNETPTHWMPLQKGPNE